MSYEDVEKMIREDIELGRNSVTEANEIFGSDNSLYKSSKSSSDKMMNDDLEMSRKRPSPNSSAFSKVMSSTNENNSTFLGTEQAFKSIEQKTVPSSFDGNEPLEEDGKLGVLNIDSIENDISDDFSHLNLSEFNVTSKPNFGNDDLALALDGDEKPWLENSNKVEEVPTNANVDKLDIYLETNTAGGDGVVVSRITRRNSLDQKVLDSKESQNSKSFDKDKLLAAIKAIDDNANIEYVEEKPRQNNLANRSRITENLYRGVPTHLKKKEDIANGVVKNGKLESNKVRRGSLGKLYTCG